MPQYFIARLDQMTQAVNTFAAVDTAPDGTSAGAITVPQRVSKVKRIIAVLSASAETATDSGGVVTLRLAGNGLVDGQQDITVGGYSSIAQGTPATGIFNQDKPVEFECNLAVVPGGQISLSAAVSGVDPGTPEVGFTLVFE